MRPLIYLLYRRYLNQLRRAFSKPLSAILTVLAAAGVLGTIVSAFLTPHQGIGANTNVVVACIVLGLGVLILNGVLASSQNGMYTMQDANLIFQAPIPKSYVLLYTVLDVIPTSLLMALSFTFYFPFLVGDGMRAPAYLLILFFTALMMAFIFLVFYLIYIMDIRRPGIRERAKQVLQGLMLLAVLAFFAVLYSKDFRFLSAAATFFSSPAYQAVPVFGWVQWGIVSALDGRYLTGCLPAGALLLLLDSLLVQFMLRADVDFYEKALNDSYKINEILDGVKNNSYDARSVVKVKKQRKYSAEFGPGAAALLSRQLLEMKKTSTMFTLRDFITGAVYILMAKLMNLGFPFVFGMLLFMSLTMAGNDQWNSDFKKPYVYLIPESSFRKVLYSVLPELLKGIVVSSVVVVAAGLIFIVPAAELFAYVLINASFSMVFVMTEVLSYRVMRGMKSPMVLAFLRMLFVMAAAVPSGVILAVVYILWPAAMSVLAAAPILLIMNLLIFFSMAGLSRNLFEQSELY